MLVQLEQQNWLYMRKARSVRRGWVSAGFNGHQDLAAKYAPILNWAFAHATFYCFNRIFFFKFRLVFLHKILFNPPLSHILGFLNTSLWNIFTGLRLKLIQISKINKHLCVEIVWRSGDSALFPSTRIRKIRCCDARLYKPIFPLALYSLFVWLSIARYLYSPFNSRHLGLLTSLTSFLRFESGMYPFLSSPTFCQSQVYLPVAFMSRRDSPDIILPVIVTSLVTCPKSRLVVLISYFWSPFIHIVINFNLFLCMHFVCLGTNWSF